MKISLFFTLSILLFFFGNSVFSQSVILDENFDSILGSGGNDGNWSGSVAGSALTSFGTWTLNKGFKGSGCLKMGTTTQKGELTTPLLIGLTGDAVLTFSAGSWNTISEKVYVQLDVIGGGTLSASSVLLSKGGFTDFSILITGGTPLTQVVFKGEAANNSRFFIDSIKIVSNPISAIPEIFTSRIDGVYGFYMNEVITVSNSPASFNIIGSLPNGLSFSMGVFSGMPIETGTFPISIIATNALGNSISTSIDIVIDKANQFLTNTDDVVLEFNQPNFILSKKTSADLDIFYTIGDTSIAKINNNIIKVEGIGVTEIIAKQSGNMNYKELLETITLIVLQDIPDCGVEDFIKTSLSSSYSDGTFIGNNNVVWNYVECRNENSDANGSGIDGNAIMLRRSADDSKVFSSKISTGVGSFSAKLYKGFTGAGNRQVELFINGESKGVSIPFDDYNEHVFKVDSINMAGDVVIELRNIKSMQIIVDDINWTCFDGAIGETIWDGISWSNGKPNSQLVALIKGDFQSSEDLIAYSLEIDSDVAFILSSDDELMVGDIVNNGVMKIFKGAYVLQENGAVNTGSVQVEIETAPLKRLDYMVLGTPVSDQNLYSFSSETLHNRFYEYDTFSNSFINGAIDSISSFEVGRAYGIRTPNTFTSVPQIFRGVYNGILNNDELEVSISTSGLGFNLLGNPYPSLIDLDLFFDENTHIDASAYIYTNVNDFDEVTGLYVGNNYAVYNKLGAVSADNSSFIPTSMLGTAEGFIVKSNTNTDVLFTNEMRVSNTIDSSFSIGNSTVVDRYWLELKDSSRGLSSQILVGYIEGATNGVDRLFDAFQLLQNTTSLTTLNQGNPYMIQGRLYPFNVDDVVSLRLEIKESDDYSIILNKSDGIFKGEQDVYLIDNLLKKVVNISRGAYSFYSENGVFDDRFEIVYENSLLSVDDFLSKEAEVSIYLKEKLLEIGTKNGELSRVKLLDIKGKVIFDSGILQQSEYKINCSTYAKGIYIVRIQSKGKKTINKKIIL